MFCLLPILGAELEHAAAARYTGIPARQLVLPHDVGVEKAHTEQDRRQVASGRRDPCYVTFPGRQLPHVGRRGPSVGQKRGQCRCPPGEGACPHRRENQLRLPRHLLHTSLRVFPTAKSATRSGETPRFTPAPRMESAFRFCPTSGATGGPSQWGQPGLAEDGNPGDARRRPRLGVAPQRQDGGVLPLPHQE